MEYILKYFPDLTAQQSDLLKSYMTLLREWNAKINMISRQDMEELEVRHVLHSLAIARWHPFAPGTRILDLGTGGGLPGIPLSILFPESQFLLVDGRGKKIMAVQDMITQLGLTHITARHVRAEELKEQFDYVVSRAVTTLTELRQWTRGRFSKGAETGMFVLKGGDIFKEIHALGKNANVETASVYGMFPESYFMEKYVLFVPAR